MFFLDAFQAPIKVDFRLEDGRAFRVSAPRMTMAQIIDWAAEIMNAQYDSAMDGMTEAQQREFRAMYPPIQPDMYEMRRRTLTPEGIHKVLSATMIGAKVHALEPIPGEKWKLGEERPPFTQEDVDYVLGILPAWAQENLAKLLSGLSEPPKPKETKEGESNDPLGTGGGQGSAKSHSTGANSSQPSTLLTRDSISGHSQATFSKHSQNTPIQPLDSSAVSTPTNSQEPTPENGSTVRSL